MGRQNEVGRQELWNLTKSQSFSAKVGKKPEYLDKDLEQVVRELKKTQPTTTTTKKNENQTRTTNTPPPTKKITKQT